MFLANKAVLFEESRKTRTFLIIDKDFNKIHAYFSLALKSVLINKEVSNTTKKHIGGMFKADSHFATLLIGQIGRCDSVHKVVLPGKTILNKCLSVINDVTRLVGFRTVLIECENNQKLIEFYTLNGFKYLQKCNDDTNMIQMIRFL